MMVTRSAPVRSPITTPTSPIAVVEAFLDAVVATDLDRAAELLADDVRYVNVGLPTVHGRERVLRALSLMDRPRASFEVYLHAISASGPTVLTERTDVLGFGRFRSQFWVTGRFDVTDGQLTLWRDSFDFVDVARASVRGLAAMAMPSLGATPPVGPDAAPGRPKRAAAG